MEGILLGSASTDSLPFLNKIYRPVYLLGNASFFVCRLKYLP